MQHSQTVETRSVHHGLGQFTVDLEQMRHPLVLSASARLPYITGDFIAFSKIEFLDEVLTDVDVATVR